MGEEDNLMKVLKPIIFLVVVAAIAYFFTPPNLRDGWLYYSYGRILDVTNNQPKALNAYKHSADAMPENIRFARTYARTLNDIAEATDSQSYFQTAETYAEDWIEQYSGSMELWQMYVELARAEWGQGSRSAAKYAIDRAVELMPTDYVALVYQGIIYRDIHPENRNSVFLSVPIFEQAIRVRRQTRTYWAHFELAKAYYLMGEEDSALNELNQAISEFPPRWLRIEAERLKHEIQSSGRSER
jgi:tetratricopeptide (TPR) repeat protein